MSNTNTGGPAFPGVEYKQPGGERGVSVMTIVGGMTLRDYFAAKALQAHLTHDGSDGANELGVAKWAYEMADAMLKARDQ